MRKNNFLTYRLIYLLCAISVCMLASCIDYNDAGRLLNIKVHLKNPAGFKDDAALDNQEILIKSKNVELKAMTDENGIATFEGCMPDVYNISSYVELTGEEYAEKSGSQDPVEECMITAALNEQLFDEAREQSPIELESNIMAITPKGPIDPTDPTKKLRSIVISKIYSSGSKDSNNKNYMTGRYIELYNQSDQPADLAGMYIALLESGFSSARPWSLAQLTQYREAKEVVAKQIYRVPTDKEYILEGGKCLVIAISATDHSDINGMEHDLSNADFETAGGEKDNLPHNANVTKLENIYSFITNNYTMNLMQGGPCGVILFQTDEDVTKWENTYGYGKTKGQEYKFVPRDCILDGVDFLKNRTTIGPDLETKRLYSDIDAGYTNINALAGYTGEVVYRKTARVYPDGRKKLMDTNNSSNDFKVSTTIKPREYDQE